MKRRRFRRMSVLDGLSATRKKLRTLMGNTIERVPLMEYGAALHAIDMARRAVIKANRELGRPTVLSGTARRRKRAKR